MADHEIYAIIPISCSRIFVIGSSIYITSMFTVTYIDLEHFACVSFCNGDTAANRRTLSFNSALVR